MPMPAIASVSSLSLGATSTAVARLKLMAEPPRKVGERRRCVRRPELVRVLVGEPWERFAKLVDGRRQRQAVADVLPTIAEREELGLEEVRAAQRAQRDRLADEQRVADAALPSRR